MLSISQNRSTMVILPFCSCLIKVNSIFKEISALIVSVTNISDIFGFILINLYFEHIKCNYFKHAELGFVYIELSISGIVAMVKIVRAKIRKQCVMYYIYVIRFK